MAYILQIYVQILTNMYITCSSGMPPKCDEISSMCGSIALAHSAGETWAMGWQGLAYTRYCHCLYGIVHGIQMGGRGRVRYCAIDVQKLCSADGSTHTESNKLYRKVKHRYRPKSFSTPTANGQIAPWSGSARGVGRGAGSHTPSTASESIVRGRWEWSTKEWLIRAQKLPSKALSCKSQGRGGWVKETQTKWGRASDKPNICIYVYTGET